MSHDLPIFSWRVVTEQDRAKMAEDFKRLLPKAFPRRARRKFLPEINTHVHGDCDQYIYGRGIIVIDSMPRGANTVTHGKFRFNAYREPPTPKIHVSHFIDRLGKAVDDVRRTVQR